MRISDWSSDVCSSDLAGPGGGGQLGGVHGLACQRLVQAELVADQDERGAHGRAHVVQGTPEEGVEAGFVDWHGELREVRALPWKCGKPCRLRSLPIPGNCTCRRSRTPIVTPSSSPGPVPP